MSSIVAIIAARGGSKGIPKKNIYQINGKPLIAWSIIQAKNTPLIDSVWVSSDDEEILSTAANYGALKIHRPAEISGDAASSESAWLHAIDSIESQFDKIDLVIALQATSPLRESNDLNEAIKLFKSKNFDSIFSATEIEDYFLWQNSSSGLKSFTYDYRNRKPRQLLEKKYLENGSFYIFKPDLLRRKKNRLGGKIGFYLMSKHLMFQIDNLIDIKICESIMKGFEIK